MVIYSADICCQAKRTFVTAARSSAEWCSWCHVLDRYFRNNPALTASRDRNYVMVKVNFSPENENKAVLARYPFLEKWAPPNRAR